ncbi:hypothetical protein [Streptomyces phaeochromogenes]|uniref:hypothetical protein n=1 Tax=Streptomyces phaeochromogenes TaxID=1923 RepID=UPI003713B46A
MDVVNSGHEEPQPRLLTYPGAETAGPDDPFTTGLRESYNRLESERKAAPADLAVVDAADAAEPARPTAEDANLLDGLPYLTLNLVNAPE